MTYTCAWTDDSGLRRRRVDGPAGTLAECCAWLAEQPHVSGPNGPLTSLELGCPDGHTRCPSDEIRRLGLRSAYRLDYFERARWGGLAD